VNSTADLKGMSMRVPNNEVDLLVWGPNGAGANVSPIPWQEAQLAIRQGLVKAIELPADFVIPFKFQESAKHLALTRHRHQVVYMTIADGVVRDVSFEGVGCAIAKASASLMTEALRGLTVDEARQRFSEFQSMVTAAHDVPPADLGKLSVLAGVREFPTRVKCASLAWHTAKAVLDGAGAAPVTTE